MIIKEITRYLQGKLNGKQQYELWMHFLQHPQDLALLETYLLYRAWFESKTSARKPRRGDRRKPAKH